MNSLLIHNPLLSNFKPHIALMHDLWKRHVQKGDTVIDATCGNGHDSLLLAELALTQESGVLHCIDIQTDAIKSTHSRLQGALLPDLLSRVHFHNQSHSSLPPCSPSLIVYNLGYLPGSDKRIKTTGKSTIDSLINAAQLIDNNGLISITCYPGHPEGAEEEKQVLSWVKNLSHSHYASYNQWINRPNSPSCVIIAKQRE